MCLPQHTCVGQQTIHSGQLSPATIWVLGIKFRLSGLVTSAFSPSAGTDLSYFKIWASHLPSLEL